VRDLGVGPDCQSARPVLGLGRRESPNMAPETRPQAPQPRHAALLASARESCCRCFLFIFRSRRRPKQQGRLRRRQRPRQQQRCRRRKRRLGQGFRGPWRDVCGVCWCVFSQWRHRSAVLANCYGMNVNKNPSKLYSSSSVLSIFYSLLLSLSNTILVV